MRLFKASIIGLSGLFIFITLLSLLIPSKIMVTKAVAIHADAGKVFTQISDLQNWKNWQPVFKRDSANIVFGKDSTGNVSSIEWESKGKKNKFVITSKKDNAITASLLREGESEVLNTITILPVAEQNQVQVEWNALIKLKWYPWEKFYGIFIEKVTGQGYEDALNSLKAYVEAH
ncbi:MAG TPA: SRPBCC family protein [Ferruginibacter sp.]|nr:SRPBCC family protein [Ferruginibacter sp.]